MSFKNGLLEGSGLDFGGPGARFWRVRERFFRYFRILSEREREERERERKRLMPGIAPTLEIPTSAAIKTGLAVTTRMQHPVSSPINRMPGSDFKKNFFFKALLAEGPE